MIEGDVFAQYYPLAAMPSRQALGDADLQNVWQQTTGIENDELQQAYTSVYGQLIGESAVIGLGILTAMGTKVPIAKHNIQRQHQADEPVQIAKRTMSRRQFMKRSVQVGAGIALMSSPLLQLIPVEEAATASTEQTKEIWENINRIVYPQLIDQTWANGRTALLLYLFITSCCSDFQDAFSLASSCDLPSPGLPSVHRFCRAGTAG